jgi:glycosyltransferase involved in cell wall biosynthesis
MRIVLVQENDVWGGAENYLAGLARRLSAGGSGDEVHVLAPETRVAQWASALGNAGAVRTLPAGILSRARLIRRLGPDVVHINDPQPKTLVAARLAGAPLVVTTYHTPSLSIRYNTVGRALWRLGAYAPNSHFIVLSEQNRTTLAANARIPLRKIHVVPLGLGDDRFRGLAETAAVRGQLGVPVDAFVAISAGRLEPQKAHEVLFEAISQALPSLPKPTVLLVAGVGTRMEELRALARSSGIAEVVRFLGHVESMPQTIRAADVHVLSSDFEGLPAVILEAMALGVPTLSTAVDGVKDLIVPGEGVLVPPRDPAALAAALVSIAIDRESRTRMGEAARRKFEEAHTEAAMVRQTRAVYERLASDRG